MYTIPFILLSVIIVVIGQIFVKKGLNSLGDIDFSSGIISSYMNIFLCPWVVLGVLVYSLGILLWLYVLTKVDLSYAYPFLGLTFVFVTLGSRWFLGEPISFIRWIGVLTIFFGVMLISKS